MEDYGYSLSGEEYTDFDTIMDRINDDYPKGQEVDVYKGESVRFCHKDFINVMTLLDDMCEQAYEEAGEYAEYYNPAEISKEKQEELLNLIAKWCDENIDRPDFWTVKNVIKEKVISEGNDV